MAEALGTQITRDTLFGGRLVLDQPARGHRVGTDAVLLAAAAPRGFVGRVCDAGAGVGAVGLAIALTSPQAQVVLIEKDVECAALAGGNIVANRLEARASVVICDLLSQAARRAPIGEPADLVLTNPPFLRADRVRSSPDEGRRTAHILPPGGLEDWLRACIAFLSGKGSLVLIHRTDALPELLSALDGRLGALTLMSVHSRIGQPATRVLLRGTKGSRAPLAIAPPLVLHEGDGFTPVSAQLHAGAASLDW